MSEQTKEHKLTYGFWATYLGMITVAFCVGWFGHANVHRLFQPKVEFNPIVCVSGFQFANTVDGLVLVADPAGNKISCQ